MARERVPSSENLARPKPPLQRLHHPATTQPLVAAEGLEEDIVRIIPVSETLPLPLDRHTRLRHNSHQSSSALVARPTCLARADLASERTSLVTLHARANAASTLEKRISVRMFL